MNARKVFARSVAAGVLLLGAVALLLGMRYKIGDDARWLASFNAIEELKASDVGDCAIEEPFQRDGMDFVGVRYRHRDLPPRFLSWLHVFMEPYLIFDSNGLRVDSSFNYNDDPRFVRRWPELFSVNRVLQVGL